MIRELVSTQDGIACVKVTCLQLTGTEVPGGDGGCRVGGVLPPFLTIRVLS